MAKSELREQYLAQRLALNASDRNLRSEVICQNLARFFEEQGRFSQVCLFYAVRNEPVLEALREGIGEHYRFALPVVQPERQMEFFAWHKNTVLQKNRFNIWEPSPSSSERVAIHSETALLVPAVAVDERGFRIGFGGGFYDTFMASHSQCTSIAVVFSEFYVKELPREEWDKNVDWICTEKGIVAAKAIGL